MPADAAGLPPGRAPENPGRRSLTEPDIHRHRSSLWPCPFCPDHVRHWHRQVARGTGWKCPDVINGPPGCAGTCASAATARHGASRSECPRAAFDSGTGSFRCVLLTVRLTWTWNSVRTPMENMRPAERPRARVVSVCESVPERRGRPPAAVRPLRRHPHRPR